MNRFPLWKYLVLGVALVLGVLYTAPNFFGEAPAVQVSALRSTVRVDLALMQRLQRTVSDAGLQVQGSVLQGNSAVLRLASADDQLRARDVLDKALNPNPQAPAFVVALNLVSRTPQWMQELLAKPMYLGLDLRGGVHFLLQVDMAAALQKKLDTTAADLRLALRSERLRHQGIAREAAAVVLTLRPDTPSEAVQRVLAQQAPDLQWIEQTSDQGNQWRGQLRPEVVRQVQEQALKQNITTLHNRINELGVAEPVIQQQGADRIVVQLPGVQDTAKAKDILGRTATLEIRMVDESAEGRAAEQGQAPMPFGSAKFFDRNGQAVIVKRDVVLTGDNLNDAQPGFDSQTQEPAVHLNLDAQGARIFKDVTRDNVGKRMAILLFEKVRARW